MTLNTQCNTCGYVNMADFICENCTSNNLKLERELIDEVVDAARDVCPDKKIIMRHYPASTVDGMNAPRLLTLRDALDVLDKFREGEK